MADDARATRYAFGGVSGYLVHPDGSSADAPIALGHTALVPPWQDTDVHLHRMATEIFILLWGRLLLLVEERVLTLRRILEHVRNSEADYLEAIRWAQSENQTREGWT